MAWSSTVPHTGTRITDIPIVHSSNWDAIDAWLSAEHEDMASLSAGMHIPGSMTTLSAYTDLASILSISNPQTGSLAWCIAQAMTYVLRDGWQEFPDTYQSTDILVGMTSSQAMTYQVFGSGFVANVVHFDDEVMDSLDEFSAYVFTPKATGLFQFDVMVTYYATNSYKIEGGTQVEYPFGWQGAIHFKAGVSTTARLSAGFVCSFASSGFFNESSQNLYSVAASAFVSGGCSTVHVSRAIYLTAGQTTSIGIANPRTITIMATGMSGGNQPTYLSIKRIA